MKGKGKLSVEESIRIEAYLLSEKAGHPSGMDSYFWEEAKAIVQARAAVVAEAVKVATKKPAAQAAKPKTAPKGKADAKPAPTPKAAAKAKGAAKPKTAAKKPAVNGANGTDHQLSLDGGLTAPARNRPLKK